MARTRTRAGEAAAFSGKGLAASRARHSPGVLTTISVGFLKAAAQALSISRALRQSLGAANPEAAEEVMQLVLTEFGIKPEYAVVREASTLMRPTDVTPQTQWRALIAAKVGSVRLIDNAPWTARR